MCACEPGYTCTRCTGTPADPGYLDLADERERDREPVGACEDDGDETS